MEELMSANVRIVLSIKEGKGFEQILQATSIVVTLDGHSLETEAIEASSNPQYAHDLVWEVDKNKLRKMRSAQVPLKLECFALKGNNNKEKLGYLLLSIRSAQIVPRNANIDVKANWFKLLGLKSDLRVHKPELLIALSIHEQDFAISNNQPEPKDSEEIAKAPLQSNVMTPILLHDERLVQLGPLNTCQDLFLINIVAVSATNIKLLLPNEHHPNLKDNLSFWCQILENDVYFNPFKKDYEEVWMLNEKIVVRIRSSLKVLKEYLQSKPYLFIYFKYKDVTIGQSEVNLQPLVPTDNIQSFLKSTENGSTVLSERCFLRANNDEKDKKECKNVYIDLHISLQHVGLKSNSMVETPHALHDSTNNMLPINTYNFTQDQKSNFGQTNHSEIDCHRNPGGDFGKCVSGTYALNYSNTSHNANKHSASCEYIKDQPVKTAYSKSVDTMMCQCNKMDCTRSVEAYHCYCLNVSLIAIKLLSSKLVVPDIEIRFHHPKADISSAYHAKIPLTLGEKIKLENVECKLIFISALDEIQHLLLCFPPKVSIHGAGNVKACISECVLDVKKLFYQNKPEYQYNILLYDMEQNEIGNLDVRLSLEDHGPYYRVKKGTSRENLGPPILDDSLAYKIVDELETWKERQKEIFKVELKRKEQRHLNLLSEEWKTHRENLESKLACSVEQCKMLANSLNNATEDLRTRRLKSLEKEARLIKANEDLQWRYEMKIKELKDSLCTMQEEFTSKINVLEKRKVALEAQVEPLITENEKLQLLITKQSEELETLQKGSLTQDQTASLLQELKTLEEKLQSAQESKSFFKEQWAKAVREIHRMKIDHQQAIQVQIKNSKEELQCLDLEDILCADTNALTNDQIILGQIQKEIDVIKPKPSFLEKDISNQVFTPSSFANTKISQNTARGISKKFDENDDRLQALIEERDSLLKTGSYTIDDAVIIKLNTEIRSLMMR